MRREGESIAELHEINVTPFIDVMLVLLIVFMVAAPLATVDIPVELPSAALGPQPRSENPIFLTLQADRSLTLNDTRVTRGELPAALNRVSHADTSQRLFLRVDKSVSYEALMGVMDALRSAGYAKIALMAADAEATP